MSPTTLKKNILIFGHGYATQFIDISNQYTKLFPRSEYRVTVVYLTGPADEAVQVKHLADEVIFLDSPKSSTRGLKIFAVKKMLQLHRQYDFQIAICHRYKPTYIMLLVNLLCKKHGSCGLSAGSTAPRGEEVQSLQALKSPEKKSSFLIFSVMHELGTMKHLMRKLFIACFAGKNFIMAGVSDAVRDDLRQSVWGVPKKRVITLHNMIDVDATTAQILDKSVAREFLSTHCQVDLTQSFIFGTMGRLAINKDQTTLISAFAKIKTLCPNAKLIIMGSGQLENQLHHQITALGLTNDIFLTGFITDSFRYVSAFDVYISSSIQEAFGRVLLEAMLAKVPIIATAVNGVPEVIHDAGILIPAKNSNSMSDAMLALYQNQTRSLQLGQRGYQRAIAEFSLKRFNEIFWGLPIFEKDFHEISLRKHF